MSGTFCVTIDTEADCDVHWRRSDPLTFESVLSGIPRLLRPLWDRWGVRPVYFVSPEVVQDDACCEVLAGEAARGAEIGSHLHGEVIEPRRQYESFAGKASKDFPCLAYDDAVEAEKIARLTELIERRIGVRPVSYRAARYGADLATIAALESLGYKVDSSVTPEIDWRRVGGCDHSRAPKQPYFVGGEDLYRPGAGKVLEAPITISGKRLWGLGDRWMFYRWLRPTHMTVLEMRRLAGEFLREHAEPVLTMMFHSMEIIPRATPFVRTRLGQRMFLRRLERMLAWMVERGVRPVTLAEVYDAQLR